MPGQYRYRCHSRFNEAAARERRIPAMRHHARCRVQLASMRPPPASGGYVGGSPDDQPAGTASMRPPPASGGYRNRADPSSWISLASMRPPPASGGYRMPGQYRYRCHSRFNEAAARERRIPAMRHHARCRVQLASMRPPPASGGYVGGSPDDQPAGTASMRPPPASGGYRNRADPSSWISLASMRPPPASGGYDL